MSFYTWAFTDDSDPFQACQYGVTTHPKYHQCDNCPSAWKCAQALTTPKPEVKPDDLPCGGKGICGNCPYPFQKCPLFN